MPAPEKIVGYHVGKNLRIEKCGKGVQAGSEAEKRQVRWYITLTEDCNTVR